MPYAKRICHMHDIMEVKLQKHKFGGNVKGGSIQKLKKS